MNEALLQFIWQHSLYSPINLVTTAGDAVTVIQSGKLNKDAGPDFLEARVKIGTTLWVGNIEMHLNASDWMAHGHQHDPSYQNIILHVVLHNDLPGVSSAPVLELNNRIPEAVVEKYEHLIQTTAELPCAGQLMQVKTITRDNWLDRLLAERWEQKLVDWKVQLSNTADDWRNLLYWRLAANFGFKTNTVPFLLLAQSIPLNVLARHRHQLEQIEALLFGQSGLLQEAPSDSYTDKLMDEYGYLRKKYSLSPVAAHLWKFLRMRPANFPTVRIAQFAMLLHQSEHLFSKFIEAADTAAIGPLLDVTASTYWDSHYRFGEGHEKAAPKSMGKDSVNNIIINTIAPIQFLYASREGDPEMRERALDLLNSVPPEKNNITDLWRKSGWPAANAARSQGQIQLFNNYCSGHKCLKCAIGLDIIKAK